MAIAGLAYFTACAWPGDTPEYDPGYTKGMTIFFQPPRNAFAAEDFSESLSRLRGLGINTLFLVPYRFTADERSSTIVATSKTLPDSQLVQAIALARDSGFAVVLKPHIDLLNGAPRFKLAPSDHRTWLAQYQEFILHYVRIALDAGLEEFVVGTELDKAVEHPDFFRFCDSLRSHSPLKLTYAASFDHFLGTAIWDHVDVIGINGYFNLDANIPASESTVREAWNYWLNLVSRFADTRHQPAIFTEVAYFSRAGAAVNPGDWSTDQTPTQAVQRMGYEALLSQAWQFRSIEGIVWWQWELGGIGGPDNNDATPRGKPAEEVLRRYWSE